MKGFEVHAQSSEYLFQHGCWTFNTRTRIIECSEGIWFILGYEPALLPNPSKNLSFYLSFIHPDDLKSLKKHAAYILAGQNFSTSFTYRIIDKNQKVKKVYQKIQVSEQAPYLVYGYLTEATELIEHFTEKHQEVSKENHLLKISEELGHHGGWCWDIQNDIIEWSEGVYKMLGYTEHDRPKRINLEYLWKNHFYLEEAHAMTEQIERFAQEKRSEYEIHWSMRRKDGQKRLFSDKSKIHYDPLTGKVVKIIGCLTDITEQEEHRETLHIKDQLIAQNELRFGYGSWQVNTATSEVLWSEGTYQVMGVDHEQSQNGLLKRKNVFNLIDPRDRERIEKEISLAKLQKRNYKVVYRLAHMDRYVEAQGYPIYNEKDEHISTYGHVRDVTQEYLAKQKLKKNEELLSRTEKLLGIASYEAYLGNKNFIASDNLYPLYGLDPEKVESNIEAILHYIHPEDVVQILQKIEQLKIDEQPFETEYCLYPPDQPMRIIKVNAYPFWDENKTLIGFSGNVMDITEKKRLEQELDKKISELNRSNKELESFAYIASHDLQEPLRKITAFGSRLQNRELDKLSEEGKLFLERMIAATRRMEGLLNDLLSFSRLSHNREHVFKIVDLNQTLEEAKSDLEVKIKSLGAKIIVHAPLPNIEAIPLQMHQLFLNLLANAMKFKHPDRAPVIEIFGEEVYEDFSEKLSLQSNNRAYRITVKDNGIGFDQKYAERIFAIFQRLHGRTEYEGSGIGLAICKKIVENHRGTIAAEGIEAQGATFYITLPEKQGEF